MRLIFKNLILFAIFTLTLPLFGLSPDKKTHHYKINHYDLEDGLPQISIFTIAQTSNGYIWVGTQDGVARFDGKNFVNVNFSHRTRANSDDIDTIIPIGNDVFNIFTRNGIHQIAKNKITYDIYGEKFKNSYVNNAFVASDSSVWFGDFTYGAYKLNGKSVLHITKDDGLFSGRVMAFAEDTESIFIGTTNGISIYNKKSGSVTPFEVDKKRFTKSINSLLYDSMGTLWIGTRNGLFTYKKNNLEKVVNSELSETVDIKYLYKDSNSVMWIGSKEGLFRYKNNSFNKVILEDDMSNTNIITIFEDRDGSLWVGSYSGLFLIQDGVFVTYSKLDGLSSDTIWSITSDKSGNLWVGSDNGLDFFNSKSDMYEKFDLKISGIKKASPSIFSLIVDNPENMWFGTMTGGVYHINNNKAIQYNIKNQIKGNLVPAVFKDSKNNIWIGTFGKGLFRLKNGEFKQFFKDEGLVGKAITHITEDKKGRIWAGTYAGGINMIENEKVTGFTMKNGLPADGVQSIYFDKEGNGWIGTNSGGIALFKDNTLKAAHSWSSDIFNKNTYAILEDGRRNLWISSNNFN